MNCTICQSELADGSRVCKTCGHPVSANSRLEELYFSHLAANAPPEFLYKVRTATVLEKERRIVTALMFTIANVDEFILNIPEANRTQILNQALDRFAKIIYKYEGTVAKLWENTVLAFFGAPITHEDDPLRAIHAAVSIREENRAYSSQINTQYGIPLKLKLLINTGPIVIGDIKSNLKYDFLSMDQTLECMDMAICSDLPSCEVLILEDTYRFLKPFIESHQVENLFCDETKKTLNIWQLDQIINGSTKQQRLPLSQNIPMIGRQKELDLLLELSETVLAGLGRVGVISGDTGIGKSRLVLEWRRRLQTLHQPTRIRWIETQGIAFGRELAYHLLKNLIRSSLGTRENATPKQVETHLIEFLENLPGVDFEETYLYLSHLLEIPLSDSDENLVHQLNALELKAKYLKALKTFFRKLAHEQPLIIVLEDLHWADSSSIDILIELLLLSSSSPILFCLVSRHERDSSGWRLVRAARERIGPRLTRIELSNLDNELSQSFVRHLIEVDTIPEIITQVVLGKSEGNPFFIEELVRMLVNANVLIKKNETWQVSSQVDPRKIPDNLQGLLSARIDRLPHDARLTLRIASVLGRSFTERAIDQVMKIYAPDIALLEQLSVLESLGMINVSQVSPELMYKFQQILLYDAAYASIFDEDRASLHLIVGGVLESLYPEQKKRLASQLAHHFLEGKEDQKALDYLDLAGHVAMDSYAHAEAETYFKKAIKLTDDPQRLAHLYAELGETLAQQIKHREAIKIWNIAIRYYTELDKTDYLARVYARSARSAWWGYDPKRSLEICLSGLKAVEGAPESPNLAYLLQETGRAYFFNDLHQDARSYCEKALALARRLGAYDVQAEALATLGVLPNIEPEQAIASLEMAIKISESNDLFSPASRAYINLAAVYEHLGQFKQTREYLQHAIDLGNKVGGISNDTVIHQEIIKSCLWLADFKDAERRITKLNYLTNEKSASLDEKTLDFLFLRGTLFRLKGNFQNAFEIFSDVIERSRQINDHERTLRANLALAEVIIDPFLIDQDHDSRSNIEMTVNLIKDFMMTGVKVSPQLQIEAQCLLGIIHTVKGEFVEAQENLDRAADLLRQEPNKLGQIRLLFAQSILKAAQNQVDSALNDLEIGVDILEAMEGRWWRARFLLEIGNLHLKRSDPEDIDRAQSLFRESLREFKELGVENYPEMVIEKLRQVKHKSRAQAIAHRIVNQELADAARVQHTFIPDHSPHIPGYDISGILLSARETSGDFYDFIDLEDGKLGIVIADVGDKGAGAALYMAMSRTLIRTYAGEGHLPPEEVIQNVNRRILSDTQRGIFLTAFFGILDPGSGTFSYVNAGHNPPLLIANSGEEIEITSLNKTGPLVGIFKENSWETKTFNFLPGEILVFYTDGITEAQNQDNEFYGSEHLLNFVKNSYNHKADAFRNAILENLHSFTGSAPRLDDITLIVMSRNPEG